MFKNCNLLRFYVPCYKLQIKKRQKDKNSDFETLPQLNFKVAEVIHLESGAYKKVNLPLKY